jgi:glutamate-1-semialdehyde aminotransferase
MKITSPRPCLGEIDMMAARIARAATGRDRIAICGYHGRTSPGC